MATIDFVAIRIAVAVDQHGNTYACQIGEQSDGHVTTEETARAVALGNVKDAKHCVIVTANVPRPAEWADVTGIVQAGGEVQP